MQSDGNLYAPYDTYEQSIYIFGKMEEALNAVGAEMSHVIRTRAFVSDMREIGGFVKAHGELFKGIEPVTSGYEAGLTTPGMMIEIEIDAIIDTDASLSGGDGSAAHEDGYSPEFKMKVALEALQGDASLADLATKYGISLSLAAKWKRKASESMGNIFED